MFPRGLGDSSKTFMHGSFLEMDIDDGAATQANTPDGLYLPGVEELAAVVGRYGAHFAECLAGDHSPERRDDVVLRDVLQLLDDVAPALAVDEDEQSAGPLFALFSLTSSCALKGSYSAYLRRRLSFGSGTAAPVAPRRCSRLQVSWRRPCFAANWRSVILHPALTIAFQSEARVWRWLKFRCAPGTCCVA